MSDTNSQPSEPVIICPCCEVDDPEYIALDDDGSVQCQICLTIFIPNLQRAEDA